MATHWNAYAWPTFTYVRHFFSLQIFCFEEKPFVLNHFKDFLGEKHLMDQWLIIFDGTQIVNFMTTRPPLLEELFSAFCSSRLLSS